MIQRALASRASPLAELRLSVDQLFDPCTNLSAGTQGGSFLHANREMWRRRALGRTGWYNMATA